MGGSDSAHRETDPRGFVLPIPGDIILYAGRWADEDAAGLVEAVRPRTGSDTSFLVDVVEMRDVGDKLFATTRKRKWFDVADVRIALDAEYVSSQDAYVVSSARSGYAEIPEMDAEAKAIADAEYAALKARMLRTTAIAGAGGTVAAALLFSNDVAVAFGLGSAASFLYLSLLQLNVDSMGEGENESSSFASRFVVLRFLAPALPFLVLGLGNNAHAPVGADGGGGVSILGPRFSVVSPQQAAAVIVGLLTYKVPLVSQTGSEAVDSLAEMPLNTGTTGMLGTMAGMAARAVKGKSNSGDAGGGPPPAGGGGKRVVFVFAGPSGSGKSTLIRRLFASFPDTFGFSASHTTRAPREGEEDGVDYWFVDEGEFARMADGGEFVEHAVVHGKRYGTSAAAVDAVVAGGRVCVLDVDVQGVAAVAAGSDAAAWSPRFVWVSPPSLAVLRARLEGRGSEGAGAVARRMDAATREMEFAATSRVFDKTIVNGDLDDAYAELERFVRGEL